LIRAAPFHAYAPAAAQQHRGEQAEGVFVASAQCSSYSTG
jgi:hypothetical protein